MPVKKKITKTKKVEKEKITPADTKVTVDKKDLVNQQTEISPKEKYFYAVGRRKTSVAVVKITPSEKAGENDLIINKKKMKEYFPTSIFQNIFIAPLKATGNINKFKVYALIKGGGFRGQAEAARLGIARALVKYNSEYKKPLRDLGYLTRDARIVERKKPGLKKARRAPQWAKR